MAAGILSLPAELRQAIIIIAVISPPGPDASVPKLRTRIRALSLETSRTDDIPNQNIHVDRSADWKKGAVYSILLTCRCFYNDLGSLLCPGGILSSECVPLAPRYDVGVLLSETWNGPVHVPRLSITWSHIPLRRENIEELYIKFAIHPVRAPKSVDTICAHFRMALEYLFRDDELVAPTGPRSQGLLKDYTRTTATSIISARKIILDFTSPHDKPDLANSVQKWGGHDWYFWTWKGGLDKNFGGAVEVWVDGKRERGNMFAEWGNPQKRKRSMIWQGQAKRTRTDDYYY